MAMPCTAHTYNPEEFGTVDAVSYWEALIASDHFMMFGAQYRVN